MLLAFLIHINCAAEDLTFLFLSEATIVKALLVVLSVLAVIGAIIYLILFGKLSTV